jgi:DNA-binding NarL/FixJ family response regulator
MERALWRMTEGMRGVANSRTVAGGRDMPGPTQLSERELEIVTRLLRGDRVPAIAEALHISQSTVRNHLSMAPAEPDRPWTDFRS